jgi:hypothetical protein
MPAATHSGLDQLLVILASAHNNGLAASADWGNQGRLLHHGCHLCWQRSLLRLRLGRVLQWRTELKENLASEM